MVDDIHGTAGAYAKGCRCDECKGYKSTKARERYARDRDRIKAKNLAYYYANHETQKAKARERMMRLDPVVRRERVRLSRLRHPEYSYAKVNPERKKASDRRYQQSDKAKAYARAWRQANAEKCSEYTRRWRTANPDVASRRAFLSRMRRGRAEACEVPARDWLRLCARYANRCAYCNEPRPLTMDHVIPVTRGGRHAIGNLLPACQSCNSSKNDRLLIEWRNGRRSPAS